MSFFIDEEKEVLIDRKITVKSGKELRYLNLKLRDLTMDYAATLIDSHVLEVEGGDDEGSKKSEVEKSQIKRSWLAGALLQDENLKGWDVTMKGDNSEVGITQESVESLLKHGDVFHAVHKDFLDVITKIAHGVSNTEVRNEIKNFRK